MAAEEMSSGSPTAFQPSSVGLNRRSLSIFSRRGTETPTPATQALALTSMTMALTPHPSSSASVALKQAKRWKLSKNVEARIPEGCILRAVPKDAPKVALTPLEREMATSPNDEILRNIGIAPESMPSSPIEATPLSPLADITNHSHSPKRYYSKRERKNSQHDIIGVWRNGKTQWEAEKPSADSEGRPKTSGGIPSSPKSNSFKERKDSSRPRIQVVIPHNPSFRRPFSFVPFFSTSAIEPSSKDITVSHTFSQEFSPPTGMSQISGGPHQVSAVSPDTLPHMSKLGRYIPITTPIDDQSLFAEGIFPEKPAHIRAVSNTSSSSESGEENGSQCDSNRSSMTSLGVHEENLEALKEDGDKSRRSSTSSTKSSKGKEKAEEVPRINELIGLVRTESTQRPNSRRLSSRTGHKSLARIDSKEELRTNGPPSPTLSEAERSLEAQLSNFLSPVVAPPPPPPRRSSKRKAKVAAAKASSGAPLVAQNPVLLTAVEATQQAHKLRQQHLELIHELPHPNLRRTSSVRSVLSLVAEDEEFQPVDANAAQVVMYHILTEIMTLQDLFNAARSNKAFYQVFKSNELELVTKVMYKTCPAAWEYRETSLLNPETVDPSSAAPAPEYTPATYIQTYNNDSSILDGIKDIFMERCQSLLRAEVVTEMNNQGPWESSRVDAALWRIWTFCKVFGCNKGREDDLIAQMDWLRGGLLAHQETCTSTISTSDSFYISSVLLSAPEHFAKGNAGGLSAEELYDMLEVWNCLASITGNLIGQTEQARQFGVYENTEIRGGDIDGEEALLEWHSYLLTLGLSPILDIASHVNTDTTVAFTLASQKDWTNWSPPLMGGSRSTFLREPVARLYEERICEAFTPQQMQMQEMRSIRRKHGASFANEMREQRKLSGNSVRSVCSERPMSGWEGVLNRLDASPMSLQQPVLEDERSSSPTIVARSHSVLMPNRKPLPPLPPPSRVALCPPRVAPCPPRAAPCPPRKAPSPPMLNHDASPPPYVDTRPTMWQHPLQRAIQDEDRGTNSAEKAIFRIVEMGFTAEEAKGALKITDMGDGLKVDRAVEYLLRQQDQAF